MLGASREPDQDVLGGVPQGEVDPLGEDGIAVGGGEEPGPVLGPLVEVPEPVPDVGHHPVDVEHGERRVPLLWRVHPLILPAVAPRAAARSLRKQSQTAISDMSGFTPEEVCQADVFPAQRA